jgi:hypothetical protein
MGLKLAIWISLVLANRSRSRDLTLGCTICNVYRKELLSVWYVCLGGVWIEGGFARNSFQGWGVGNEVLLEQVQLNFSFQNKYIIVLPCGLLVENNTFSKIWIFKSFTGYTDGGGYENRNVCILIIIIIIIIIIINQKAMQSFFWLF